MYAEIMSALKKMYPTMKLAVCCQNDAGTYQEQYNSLVWNDEFCNIHPELSQNPNPKPTLQQIIDSGYLEADLNLSRKKELKKQDIKFKRKSIMSGGVKYSTAADSGVKFVYSSDDQSISRITNVLNNGASDRNWKDVDGKFHLFTNAELQSLLNIMIELMEKSFDNEKTLDTEVNNCLTEQEVDNVTIATGWETIPYELV